MSHTSTGRRRMLGLLGATAASGALPGIPALASDAGTQDFPTRALRLVVPFTPGGGTDVVGRSLAAAMSEALGQSIVVDNRPGGGTVIGSNIVAKAKPDGYTLLLTTTALAINDTLVKDLPYDTDRDFSDIGLICVGPNVLVTHPKSRFKTLDAVIRYAKANPGKLTYGSSGNGSAVHLAAELFKMKAGVDLTHIPYKGAAQAYTDLVGGRLDFVFATAGGVAKYVEEGTLQAVALTSRERTPAYPGIPTIAERVPGYSAEVWYAILAPAGTPPDIVAALNGALNKAANDPGYKSRVSADGMKVAAGTPQEMRAFRQSEQARWRQVIHDGKITTT
ncbi:tripartite tricarboxylate transporter substrate binding protein [Pigmentiphaga sp. H8]|uniref:tripartite tricarboxylate transporter substrate binding protein n=1 Tax=Pigmentiphaga sp. H8 TaxID=2488560 RepID=UPI000F5A7C02|nr:tripartite tricarboxylate transporter substrate binding protein [Pigmentiphaga sp. H8]AZG10792.1 tripartite tricarboxylate transporter substrate binding protein [Pigmentiphaga sp. H8]